VKRALYMLLGLSLVAALAIFLLRRGGKDEEKSVTEPEPSPAATPTPLAHGPLPPPAFLRPDASPAPSVDPEDASEAALTMQLRNLVKTNPAKVVELALEERRRFGDSHYSDDRDSMLVQGYVNLHDMAAARAEMPYYYQHHPHGRWGDYLFALTNVGPNPPQGAQP